MTHSRAKSVRGGLIGLALLATSALFSASVLAQDSIEVESLDTLDPLEVRLSDAALDDTLWSGTSIDMLRLLLDGLPDARRGQYEAPALAELSRAVLVSGGRPPRGGRGDDDLAWLRADRLLASGGAHDAFDLLERTPDIHERPDLALLHTELAFALRQDATACRTARALIEEREQPYWQRARAYCLALEGLNAGAELSADLARDQSPDPDFDRLLFGLTLGGAIEEAMPSPRNGLTLSMARNQPGDGRSTPEIYLSEAAPAWLTRLFEQDSLPPLTPSQDPAAALVLAEAERGEARRVLLESVLVQPRDREAAAVALEYLLSDAAEDGRFLDAAHYYGAEVQSLPINTDTLQAGYRFALAALAVGDVETARAWRNGLVNGPEVSRSDDPIAEAIVENAFAAPVQPETWVGPAPARIHQLDLIIAIAADELVLSRTHTLVQDWPQAAGRQGAQDVAMLVALGLSQPDNYRLNLLDARPTRVPPSLMAMEAATAAGADGESVLLALRVMLEAEGLTPYAAGRIARTLDAAGLRAHVLRLVTDRLISAAG